jgi:ribonuclease P protein component
VPTAGSLRTARDFKRVYSEGVRARSNGLTLHLLPASGSNPGRLGLAVPKSIGSAIVRNRLRRRLRSAARDCDLTGSADAVLGAAPETGALSYQELVMHLRRAQELAGRRLTR